MLLLVIDSSISHFALKSYNTSALNFGNGCGGGFAEEEEEEEGEEAEEEEALGDGEDAGALEDKPGGMFNRGWSEGEEESAEEEEEEDEGAAGGTGAAAASLRSDDLTATAEEEGGFAGSFPF